MSEAAFQRRVIDTARLYGWRVHHARPARTAQGWRTPVTGDAGYVDLTMARRGRLLLVELKAELGRLRPEQQVWLDELRTVPGLEIHVWRPSDWDAAIEVLR